MLPIMKTMHITRHTAAAPLSTGTSTSILSRLLARARGGKCTLSLRQGSHPFLHQMGLWMVVAPSWDPRRLAGWEPGRLSAEGRVPSDRWRRLMDRRKSSAAPAAAAAIDGDPDAESCALQTVVIWSPPAQAGSVAHLLT